MAASGRGQPGDETARLIEKYFATVQRVCGAHLGRRVDIEDAVQETFVQFLLADRSRIVNPEAWLVRVALRVCGHSHRWRYEHPEAGLFDESARTSELGELEDVLYMLWFERVVSHLPDLDRRVLIWLYLRDMSRESVAEQLGVSTDHLRVIAHRARQRAQRTFIAFDDSLEL